MSSPKPPTTTIYVVEAPLDAAKPLRIASAQATICGSRFQIEGRPLAFGCRRILQRSEVHLTPRDAAHAYFDSLCDAHRSLREQLREADRALLRAKALLREVDGADGEES